MPWDGTELWLADFSAEGGLSNATLVAGGTGRVDLPARVVAGGELHFISDRTGWWNLYRIAGWRCRRLPPKDAEFGTPQWVFGLSQYAFLSGGRIACVVGRQGLDHLGVIEPDSGVVTTLETPFTAFGTLVVGRRGPAGHAGRRPDDGQLHRHRRCFNGAAGNRAQVQRLADCTRLLLGRRADGVPDQPTSRPLTPSTTRRSTGTSSAPDGELPPLIVHPPRRADRPARPASHAAFSSGPAAASPLSTSTTAAAPATAAPTATGCAGTGAWSISTTASTPPATWPSRAAPMATRSPSAAAAPAATRRWPR